MDKIIARIKKLLPKPKPPVIVPKPDRLRIERELAYQKRIGKPLKGRARLEERIRKQRRDNLGK